MAAAAYRRLLRFGDSSKTEARAKICCVTPHANTALLVGYAARYAMNTDTCQITCNTEPRKSCSGPGMSIAFTSSRSSTPLRARSRSAAFPGSSPTAPPSHPLGPPRRPQQLPFPRIVVIIPSASCCCFFLSASWAALCCSGESTVKFMRYRLWNAPGRVESAGGAAGVGAIAGGEPSG